MKKGIIYILITAFAFSTMEVAGKMISLQINPFQLTFIRFLIGGIVLLPFAIKDLGKRQIKLSLKDFGFFVLTGTIGILISMSFFQLAVLHTRASVVAVIFSTNPVFTIPFAAMLLKEKLNKRKLISLAVSLGGILFFLNPLNINPEFKGIILVILSAITFSLYSVVSKLKIDKYGSFALNCFTFLTGSIMLLVFLFIFKVPIISGITSHNIIELLYLGFVVTGGGYCCYFLAMKETSASTASIIFFIKPALAPIISLIVLGEAIKLNTVFGIIFIILSAYIMLSGNKIKAASEHTGR